MVFVRRLLFVLLGLAAAWPAAALDLAAMSTGETAALQRRLADAGCYRGTVDGIAGRGTRAALDRCPLMDPMLRIEAGRHTAILQRLDVSADGSLLATGSDDRTVRLWRLPEGRLERVLRLPVGEGNEGKVYAVAISPDGRFVAAGGFDAYRRIEAAHYVTLFDAASGAVLQRLGPLPNVAFDLDFTSDGKRLAVGIGDHYGVRVFDVASGRQVFADGDYGGSVYGLAFDRSGRLAVAATDGGVRLYDASGRRVAAMRAPGEGTPYDIAFSPDGSHIALGYVGATRLDVLDGETLALLFSPDTGGVDRGGLNSVAFSNDGTVLYAAGIYDVEGENPVLAFAEGGEGARRALPGPQDTVFDLAPYGARGVVYGGGDPAIGVIDDAGERVLDLGPVIADLHGARHENFTVSADAGRVRFTLSEGAPVVFDVAALSLNDAPMPEAGLREADTTSLNVEGWEGTQRPTLNGRPLQIFESEFARSLAVVPGAPSPGFLLGSDFFLYGFNARGERVWLNEAPSAAWGINLSADSAVAVVAYGDGTIRWHRTLDGAELLTLFVHAPTQRWVAWTPSGYYAASPGGEDLIGWQVNRGWTQAPDFFPASRLRARFYRPDIVQAVLATRDEAAAVTAANAAAKQREETGDVASELPPVVTLAAPPGNAFSTTSVTLRYRLRSPSGRAVSGVDVLIDGRPVSVGRGLARVEAVAAAAEESPACPVFEGARGLARVEASEPDLVTGLACSVTLSLPPRDIEISLVAHAGALVSEPATLSLTYGGAEEAADAAKPKLYALVVGVSDYEIDRLRLSYAAQDARDMAAALAAQKDGLYSDVEARVLTDREATRGAIVEGLAWLEEAVGPRDVGLLFMAGHGVTDAKQRFYFVSADGDPERLLSTAVSGDVIQETIGRMVGKALFFIDACHSAAGLVSTAARSAIDITGVVNELTSAEHGVVMFSSSTGREVSFEDQRWENGAFTEALLEALAGKGDYTGDGRLSIAEFDLYLSERVKELTDQQQHPVVRKPDIVPDFPVALVMR